jgi:hypothetical protein
MAILIIGQLYAFYRVTLLAPSDVLTGIIVTSFLVGQSAWITWAVIRRSTEQLRVLSYITGILFFDFINGSMLLITKNISKQEINRAELDPFW